MAMSSPFCRDQQGQMGQGTWLGACGGGRTGTGLEDPGQFSRVRSDRLLQILFRGCRPVKGLDRGLWDAE